MIRWALQVIAALTVGVPVRPISATSQWRCFLPLRTRAFAHFGRAEGYRASALVFTPTVHGRHRRSRCHGPAVRIAYRLAWYLGVRVQRHCAARICATLGKVTATTIRYDHACCWVSLLVSGTPLFRGADHFALAHLVQRMNSATAPNACFACRACGKRCARLALAISGVCWG